MKILGAGRADDGDLTQKVVLWSLRHDDRGTPVPQPRPIPVPWVNTAFKPTGFMEPALTPELTHTAKGK